MKSDFKTIDEYIETFEGEVKKRLEQLRALIKEESPESIEAISYQMPTFKLNGKNLIHFAGFKSHIGLYPTPSGTDAPIKGMESFKTGKGTLQFPLDQPLPLSLVREVVKFRVQELTK